jgi:hypothetical protein
MTMMMNTTSAATTVTAAYYQSFESETRLMTPPPNEQHLIAQLDEKSLAEARQQTSNLILLEEGWNGYNALPLSAASINRAMHWLDKSYAECKDADVRWYKPNVSASAEGEVAFEWWASDRSLIVYIDEAEMTFHKSLDGEGPTQHTHGDAPMGKQQAELMRWFGE